jgi:hypothetical protein
VEHFQNLWEEPESILKETTNSERPFSATIKALLIHTAEDLGNEGPDYQFGWGLIDAKGAADFLTKANKPKSDKFLLERAHSQRQNIQLISDGQKPLKVTMAWTDKPGQNIVNDLDLRVREVTANGSETYYPWSLNPNKPDRNATANRPNKLDNVEQVLIKKTKKDAKYVILVDGDIDDSEYSQYHSLLIEGAQKPAIVGMIRCAYVYRQGKENKDKIISASIKPTAEGYSFTMIEENEEEHIMNFDKNLYLLSGGTKNEGDLMPWNLIANSAYPPVALEIKSNGSFHINMWASTRSVCKIVGTVQFVNGAKNEIFGLTSPEQIDSRFKPSNEVSLVSAKGVDYRKLRDLLKAKKWKEANRETNRVMLKVASRESEGSLRLEDVENFSCTDLGTIDKLWVKYSNGKYGISVQKQIYQSKIGTKGTMYNNEGLYSHLPAIRGIDGLWTFRARIPIFSRVSTCRV